MENENNINNIKGIEDKARDIKGNKVIENKYKQIKGLKSYKNLSEIELRDLAKKKLADAPDKDLEIASLFSDKKEVLLAKKLLNKYLTDYTPSSVSDKNNLRHLIYLEMVQIRLQDKMNAVNATSNAIPLQMIDSIHKNLREINDLKLKLGLIGEKREETKSDMYMAWDLLKDKFKRWREENQGTRTVVCPHCGKMIMLKIRTTAWEAQKHCMFQDRVLANKHLIKLYLDKKITKEDVAAVLETSTDYVIWLMERWKTNPNYKQIEIDNKSSKESLESGEVEIKELENEQLESGQVVGDE
jgi:DNA-directed RNA polymerase subunit RPC12/RpoP